MTSAVARVHSHTQELNAAAEPTSLSTNDCTKPIAPASTEINLPESATVLTKPTRGSLTQEQTTRGGQDVHDTHIPKAPTGSDLPADQCRSDTLRRTVGGDQTGTDQRATPAMNPKGPPLADPFLALAADIVDDLERTRIANENRLRMLTRTEPDEDGEMRGLGMDERDPNVARTAALVEMLAKAEHQAVLNLNKILREHSLGPWIKAQKGVGEKTGARLLAVVGDPYVNLQTGEVRTVSQLWAYCGHGDPTRRKHKGMTQDDLFRLGNPVAKKRTWLIATSCLKAQGPYADVYYARKTATEGREHGAECVRCGPSGHPAQPGSPWSDAHRHADALRIVGKEFLRDLWLEAKRLHESS